MMRWLFLNHVLVLYINILVFPFCILLLYIFNISWLSTIFDLFFHLLIIIKRKRLRRSFFVQGCLNDNRGTIRFGQLRCGSSCSLQSTASGCNTKQVLAFICHFIFNDTLFLWRLNDLLSLNSYWRSFPFFGVWFLEQIVQLSVNKLV